MPRGGPGHDVVEAGMSLRETGLVAATGQFRRIELFQLRDDYGFAPDIPTSTTRSRSPIVAGPPAGLASEPFGAGVTR